MVPAWQDRLRAAFIREGYTLDSTGDLARVLRLPGTLHRKDSANIRRVRIVHPADGLLNGNLARYDLATFNVPAPPAPTFDSESQAAIPLAPPAAIPSAAFPVTKFALLCENCLEFKQAWEHKRALADPSPSGFDLSLANYAAAGGWTDGEIAALLFAHRSQYGEDPAKAQRPDYLAETIRKARSYAAGLDKARKNPIAALNRLLRHEFSYSTGPAVARVARIGSHPRERYELHLEGGRVVKIKNMDVLFEAKLFRNALASALAGLPNADTITIPDPRAVKKNEAVCWTVGAMAIIRAAEIADSDPEDVAMKDYIVGYM